VDDLDLVLRQTVDSRIARIFLGFAVFGFVGTLVCGLGWFISQSSEILSINDLTKEDRQRLVEEFFDVSGKRYAPSWFAPSVGYTLLRGQKVTAWSDTFTSNEIGYRTGPVEKPADVFRIVFVGDSWTYGMGVREQESFPKRLEELANRHGGYGQKIETWSLALPGYNTMNQVSGLEVFFDRIEPDAVVFCPTRNDNDSGLYVLPNGSVRRPTGVLRDGFGADHSLTYTYRFLDSFPYLDRWNQAFGALAKAEHWLGERGVPVIFFFVAYWEPEFIHRNMSDAGCRSPYVIAPNEMASGKWKGPPPWFHGTPETYDLYARMVYAALAETLDWTPIDTTQDELQASYFENVPSGDWTKESLAATRRWWSQIPNHYRAHQGVNKSQCAGPMDCPTGLMGRATTVLILRRDGSDRVRIRVRRVEDMAGLYPVRLTATIPDEGGSTLATAIVLRDGPVVTDFELTLPESIAPGSVIEVQIRADRAALASDVLALRSVYIERIEQY